MAKIATISAEFLAACPVKNGFRLRGHDMTRIETFTDAAFAFAVTMLVISVDEIPGTFDELLAALKGVPAFAACFAQIMLFWYAHLVWSRRFGLEDMPTVILSCLLVFVVMVYIYPLKILFSSMFAYFSSGWLPSEMEIRSIEQLSQVFVIFGTGFVALSVVITSLNLYALKSRQALALNPFEIFCTKEEVVGWGSVAIVGVFSILIALFAQSGYILFAGWIYMLLFFVGPLIDFVNRNERRRLSQDALQ